MNFLVKKVCVLGDFSVGKTSLVRRSVDNEFSDEYLSTVGVKISRKDVKIKSEIESYLRLMIWDLEGGREVEDLPKNYILGGHGCLVVGDLTRIGTIKRMNLYIEQFQERNPDSVVVCAFNKVDLVDVGVADRTVTEFHSQQSNVYNSALTSAKKNLNVGEIFQSLAFGLSKQC